jgi:hypothetical protein
MKSAAGASLPAAREAAEQVLAAHGSAADAIVAAFFAIAGSQPSGLFAPTVALVAGAAAVGRVFDGRAAQPGAGVARPRGFTGDVPLAARAAVPRAPHAMLLLHATFGRRSLREVVRPGAAMARAVDAPKRAAFIDRFGELGALALSGEREAILRMAGPLASGLLTDADLGAVRVQDQAALLVDALAQTGEPMRIALEPWDAGSSIDDPIVVAAADARGQVAALAVFAERPEQALQRARESLVVPEIEVALPLAADPVLRGKQRTAPGTIFLVPKTLWSVDCGATLRAAGAALAGGLADRDANAIASALGERPLEAGLLRLGKRGALVVALATSHEARALVTGGP